MTYLGDYLQENIYGISNTNKIKVSKIGDATHLSCLLEVSFNGETWSHLFEIPFFNNIAELYFENYVYSILTQKFIAEIIDLEDITFHYFNTATINITLKEMNSNVILETLDYRFFMTLGKMNAISAIQLSSGVKKLLPTLQTSFITDKGLLAFSFLSLTKPVKLVINHDTPTITTKIPLNEYITNRYLYTLIIPLKSLSNLTAWNTTSSFLLSVEYSDGFIIPLGEFHRISESVDHHNIFYQNEYGTISAIEFLGELKENEQYKTKIEQYSKQNSSNLIENNISESLTFSYNSGYLWDEKKYAMLRILIKSYTKYIITYKIRKIINNGNQKLMPYKTDYYLNNETLKFKISENDNFHNRIF